MSRENVRSLKRVIRRAMQANRGPLRERGQESALELLARSVSFGHSRLAIHRLYAAVETGATVPDEHLSYCSAMAEKVQDKQLRALYEIAAARAKNFADSPQH